MSIPILRPVDSRSEKRKARHYRRLTRKPGPRIKRKKVYRVKAQTTRGRAAGRLLFFKTRTKQPRATIARFSTLKGFRPLRIT